MVSALGHDVPKVFTYVFGFGCGLAGLAGVLAGNVIGTEPSMALLLGPIVFVVIVVGGLGSLKGALCSSLLIGMIQTIAISLEFSLNDIFNIMGYDVDIESKINSLTQITISQLAPIVPYLLLIVVLIARPRGLLETEMFKNLPRIQVSFFILIAAFLIGLPYIFSSAFALTLLCKIGVLVIFSLEYNMLLGQTGLLSFGHAVYFGLAGYATIHLLNGINLKIILNIPVFFLPVLGFIVGLILGFLIGYLSTKRIGTAFAMISLGFCELITALTLIFVIFFNGEDGIQADRVTGQDMFGISYGPQSEVYFLILFWTLLYNCYVPLNKNSIWANV